MSIPTFVVVFSGNVLDGFDLIQVKEAMAGLIRADEEKMATLFSGKTIVMKRSTNKDEAYKVMSALKAVGADARIRLIQEKPEDIEPTTDSPNDQTEASDSQLSLSANVGFLVAPSDQVPAPALDLSGLAIAAIGDDLATQSSNLDPVNIDTSALSVKENDGSPLIEPSAKPPPLASPDFILDEPGALLDSATRDSAAVSPDTSSLSMREMQGNLVEDNENPKPQTRVTPNTSHLRTVEITDNGNS